MKKRWLAALGGTVLGGFLLSTSLVPVYESELIVVSQFGRVVKVENEAGLLFKLPDPIQTISRLDQKQRIETLATAEYVTRDRRNVVLDSYLIWRVKDAQRFLSSVRNYETAAVRLNDLVTAEISNQIGQHPLSAILNTDPSQHQLERVLSNIVEQVRERAAASLGIDVTDVGINRISFPQPVVVDIYKRMAAERGRIAQQLRAEGQEQAAKVRAETEFEVRQKLAQARRESRILVGEAEAKASQAYAEVYREHPEFYRFLRSMQAYEQIFTDKTRLILSTDQPLFDYLWAPPAVEVGDDDS